MIARSGIPWTAALSMGITLTVGAAAGSAAEPIPLLAPLFGDHAVLQRDRPVTVWGWSDPGSAVTLSLSGSGLPTPVTSTATTGSDGRWQAQLGATPAGGPYALEVTSGSKHVTANDLLSGDVWMCTGQSNMEFPVAGAKDAAAEKAAANWPRIRHLTVGRMIAGEPQANIASGKWLVCSPTTVENITAVGYFFAKRLHQDIQVPIGLVNSSYGGTRVEHWTRAAALTALPEFVTPMAQFQELVARSRAQLASTGKDYETLMRAWYVANDPGSAGEPAAWADPAATADGWSDVTLPNKLKSVKAVPAEFTGTVWLRRDVELSEAAASKGGMLNLIRVKDMNAAWVNGRSIGDSESVNWLRKQRVPAGLLHAGRNTIAIRLVCLEGECGLTGEPAQLALTPEGLPPVPLAGTWKLHLGKAFADAPPAPARFDRVPAITSLYNGMIAPLLPLTMTGILWYQGEGNIEAAYQYRTLLPTMIRDWRAGFGQGDVPFLIVQLANHMGRSLKPERSTWAELRESQAITASTVPNCGLAITIDVGEALNIHPTNKQEVGRRLALIAEAQVYHQPVAFSGPSLRSSAVEGGTMRLTFDHAEGLAASDGQPLTGFAVAGSDQKFVWATARIDGTRVIVSAPEVAAPVAARYAWASNPACNLTNTSGLPAAPFRTDTWPGVTWPQKQ